VVWSWVAEGEVKFDEVWGFEAGKVRFVAVVFILAVV
jgi:hypothetical protein